MQVFSAPEEIKPPEFVMVGGRYDHDATEREEARYMKELIAAAKAYGKHPLAGEVIRVPYADGQAVYVVAKVNGKCSLIHAETGDAWRDPQFERLATVAELKLNIERRKALAELFKGK